MTTAVGGASRVVWDNLNLTGSGEQRGISDQKRERALPPKRGLPAYVLRVRGSGEEGRRIAADETSPSLPVELL